MLTPTPDCHEHGKQNCPLVVNHVGDLEKIKEERDRGSGVQGLWHLGVWGEASVLSSPPATLVPPPPLRQVKMLQEGKVQEQDGHWDLLVIKSSLVVMETMIWLYFLLITEVSGGFLHVVDSLLGWLFLLVVREQHKLGVFPHPLLLGRGLPTLA